MVHVLNAPSPAATARPQHRPEIARRALRGMTGADPQGVGRGLTEYGDPGFSRFIRHAFLRSAGLDATDTSPAGRGASRTTSSDFTPCHRGMSELADVVARGVLEAGGCRCGFRRCLWARR